MNAKSEQVLELTDERVDMIKNQFADQAIAFTGTSKGLGVVVKGKAGYFPVPLAWFHCEAFNRSMAYADQLNQYALEISKDEAVAIIGSSMFQKIYRSK